VTPVGETTIVEGAGSRKRLVIGLVVILALAAFGAKSFQDSLATYEMDFAQVKAKPGALVQVPGLVDKSYEQKYDAQGGTFEFALLDVQTRSQQLVVRSRGVKPANFDSASQVVCVGTWREGVFDAQNILVKCPSKELDKVSGAGSGS